MQQTSGGMSKSHEKALKLLEMAERPAIAEEQHNRNATEHFAYDLVLSQTDDRV